MHARAGDDPRAARARYTQRAGAARSAGRRRERRRRERPRRGAQKGSHVPDAGAADVRHAADDQCAAGGGATLGARGTRIVSRERRGVRAVSYTHLRAHETLMNL
eukprot:2013112-Prymnesium_polylepis.1